MTVSEYEERFRISSPSLHETFVAMQGSNPRPRRSQRFRADASIIPRATTGNTMAPCVVIGERAAEMLKIAHINRSCRQDQETEG
jgi:hypothetical protein